MHSSWFLLLFYPTPRVNYELVCKHTENLMIAKSYRPCLPARSALSDMVDTFRKAIIPLFTEHDKNSGLHTKKL